MSQLILHSYQTGINKEGQNQPEETSLRDTLSNLILKTNKLANLWKLLEDCS